MSIIALTQATFARIMKSIEWVEKVSRNFSVQSLDSSPTTGKVVNQPIQGERIFLGEIVEKTPEGEDWTYSNFGDGIYPVRIAFLGDYNGGNGKSLYPSVPQDDDERSRIVWAKNFNEYPIDDVHTANRLLPGMRVVLFRFTNSIGQDYFVFTCFPMTLPTFEPGSFFYAQDSSNYSKAWHFQLKGSYFGAMMSDDTADWSYHDDRKPYNHTMTLDGSTTSVKDPRDVKISYFCRFVQGDATNLPVMHSRMHFFNAYGNLIDISAENNAAGAIDQNLGERVTVVTDVRLTRSGTDHILEKKTRELIVFWKGTESAWTNAGTVIDDT